MEEFFSHVVGVTSANSDGKARQGIIKKFCTEGASLVLEREAENEFDINAIAVYVTYSSVLSMMKTKAQIGYIPEQTAVGLARSMDAGETVSVSISEITGGSGRKKNIGVNIIIRVT